MEKQPAIGLITGSSAHIFYDAAFGIKNNQTGIFKEGGIERCFHHLWHARAHPKIDGVCINFGLVIIDEQHRFGVRQRAELNAKKDIAKNGGKAGGPIPHFLSMSATPIPRTLMLSVFGDLDLSLITELPSGRKEIQTKIIAPLARAATYDFIRQEIKSGRQAFVICPRIDAEEEDPGAGGAGIRSKKIGTAIRQRGI